MPSRSLIALIARLISGSMMKLNNSRSPMLQSCAKSPYVVKIYLYFYRYIMRRSQTSSLSCPEGRGDGVSRVLRLSTFFSRGCTRNLVTRLSSFRRLYGSIAACAWRWLSLEQSIRRPLAGPDCQTRW
jgi:hypothetical protein